MKTSSKIAIVLLLFSVVASAQQPDNIFKKNKNGDLPATRLAVTKNLTNQTQILKQINIFRIEDGLTPINPDKANDFFANTLPQNIYDNAEDKIIKANVNVPIERLPGFAAGEEYNLWQNLEVVKATVSNEGMQKYFQSVLEQFQLPTEIKKQLSEQFVSGKFEDYKLLPGSVLEQVAFLSPPATDAFISFLQKNRKNIIGAVIKGDYKIVKAVPLADHHQPLGLVIKYNNSQTWNVNDIDGVKLVDGKVYVKNSNDIPASLKAGTADNPAINLYQKTVFLPFIGDNDPDYFTKNSLDFQFVSGSDDKYLYVVGIIRHQYENTANWTGLLNIFWYKVDVADLPIQPVKKAATEKKPKVIQEAEIVADAESQLAPKNMSTNQIENENTIIISESELSAFIRDNNNKIFQLSIDKEHDLDHKFWYRIKEFAWADHFELKYVVRAEGLSFDFRTNSELALISALILKDGKQVLIGSNDKNIIPVNSLEFKNASMQDFLRLYPFVSKLIQKKLIHVSDNSKILMPKTTLDAFNILKDSPPVDWIVVLDNNWVGTIRQDEDEDHHSGNNTAYGFYNRLWFRVNFIKNDFSNENADFKIRPFWEVDQNLAKILFDDDKSSIYVKIIAIIKP